MMEQPCQKESYDDYMVFFIIDIKRMIFYSFKENILEFNIN